MYFLTSHKRKISTGIIESVSSCQYAVKKKLLPYIAPYRVEKETFLVVLCRGTFIKDFSVVVY